MTASQPAPVDSLEVRSRLVEAVKLDLVGPWAGHELGAEQLPGRERPSNWYVAGFLDPDRDAAGPKRGRGRERRPRHRARVGRSGRGVERTGPPASLIPTGTPPDRSGDVDENDDLDTVPESAGLAEESNAS